MRVTPRRARLSPKRNFKTSGTFSSIILVQVNTVPSSSTRSIREVFSMSHGALGLIDVLFLVARAKVYILYLKVCVLIIMICVLL